MKTKLLLLGFASFGLVLTGCGKNPEPHKHAFANPTYTWNADYTKCTAKRVCKTDSKHVETETVDAVIDYPVMPTYESAGQERRTATFNNAAFKAQSRTQVADAFDDLTFTLVAAEYKVSFNATGHLKETINVPSTYNEKPVTVVDDFINSTVVKKLVLPDSISEVSSGAFQGSSIEEVVGLPSIEQNLFHNSAIKKIEFTEDFTLLAENDLYDNGQIEELTMPGVETIERGAFTYNAESLRVLNIGSHLLAYGMYLAADTPSLEVINCADGNKYVSKDGILFEYINKASSNNKKIVHYPACRQGSDYDFGDTTTDIAAHAFEGVKYLKNVKLNAVSSLSSFEYFMRATSLETIELKHPDIGSGYGIAEQVFRGCKNLKSIILKDDNAYFKCENGLLISADGTTIHTILGGYDQKITISKDVTTISSVHDNIKAPEFEVDSDNTNFSSVNGNLHNKSGNILLCHKHISESSYAMPANTTITQINDYAFSYRTGLEHLDLSNLASLSTLKSSVFHYSSDLKTITWPATVVSVGSFVLRHCSNLEKLIFKGTTTQFSTMVKPSNWNKDVPTTMVIECTDGTLDYQGNVIS